MELKHWSGDNAHALSGSPHLIVLHLSTLNQLRLLLNLLKLDNGPLFRSEILNSVSKFAKK
jgi:hypothetical protein